VLISGPTIVAGSAGSPTGSALTRATYLGMNLSTRLWWMMIRSVDMQICPEFMNAPKTAASTARSGSASSKMISGFFPPSSSTADRRGTPVLEECLSRGIAFVPFCPLGWPRGADNPVLTNPVVIRTAARLGVSPAQTALQWLLQLAPNVLLIPGTGSVAHLRENLAAEGVALDDEARSTLEGVAPAAGGALPSGLGD
jgi:hypothetical protein